MHNDLTLEGFIRAVVYDVTEQKVVGFREVHNIVTNGGRNRIADLLRGAGVSVQYAGAGAGGTPPTATDTELTAELTASVGQRKGVNAQTFETGTAQFTWMYDVNEYTALGNNVFGEVGLFDQATGGLLFSHATFEQSTKNSNMQMLFTYQMRFQSVGT
jgi:hypothetical protein